MTVVQSLWLGSRLSALQVLSLRSFVAHGHEVHLYALEPIENVPAGIHLLDASVVLPKDRVFTYQRGFGRGSPSAFSNLFRYKLLLERGGWWVDTDVVCLRPFDLDADFVFASERAVDGRVTAASCVIKSPAGADWLQYCLDAAERRDPASLEWGEIGPKLIQEAHEHFALQRFLVPPQVFNPIDYFAYGELQAPAFDHARLDDSFAVHLWNQKWVSNCLDPDFDGAPDSLYAALRARYLQPTDRAYAAGEESLRHAAFQRARLEELVLIRDDAHWAAEVAAREVAELREALRVSHAEIERLLATERLLAETTVRLHESEGLVRDREARLREMEEHLGAAEQARQDSAAQVDQLRDEVGRLRGSLSWRMTRPLRAIFDVLFGR
jgi:hypothetical protein